MKRSTETRFKRDLETDSVWLRTDSNGIWQRWSLSGDDQILILRANSTRILWFTYVFGPSLILNFFDASFRIRFCFNCVINKYLRGFNRDLDISDWQSRVASYSCIMRKVEKDWKMVSLRPCLSGFSVSIQQHSTLLKSPFYSCVLSDLAFEWKWGWSWPCLKTLLLFTCKPCCSHAS